MRARAAAFISATRTEDLLRAVLWSQDSGMPLLPLGEGSNIVFAGDVDAALLQVDIRGRKLLRKREGCAELRIGAGENWHQLVAWTLEQGYYGLENLALIPGTVGAAPIQNIGAYGVELSRFLRRVHAVDLESGAPMVLDAAQCQLGYRDSVFKHRLRDKVAIHAVELALPLSPDPQLRYPALGQYLEQQGIGTPTPVEVFEAVVAIRSARLPDPAREPNAGSFFKNPVVSRAHAEALRADHPELPVFPAAGDSCKLAAAWLIERCGWKGHREHGVGVHPGHALVLVNYGGNDGAVLLALAEAIRESVAERFGVDLEIEPRIYGGDR
nr:UDP-N-acetylmuramate dehydrogenase [Parahaliea mediterranea]